MALTREDYHAKQERLRRMSSRAFIISAIVATSATFVAVMDTKKDFAAATGTKETSTHMWGFENILKSVQYFTDGKYNFLPEVFRLKTFHPATELYQPEPVMERALLDNPAVQNAVSTRIAQEYRVKPSLAADIVRNSIEHAKAKNIDPTLVLGLISAESSFNPKAVSKFRAEGLMQVITKWHPNSLEEIGLPKKTDLREQPVKTQVAVGTAVLQTYLDKDPEVEVALQKYNRGANAKPDPSMRYAKKVLDRRQEIINVVKMAMTKPEQSAQAAQHYGI